MALVLHESNSYSRYSGAVSKLINEFFLELNQSSNYEEGFDVLFVFDDIKFTDLYRLIVGKPRNHKVCLIGFDDEWRLPFSLLRSIFVDVRLSSCVNSLKFSSGLFPPAYFFIHPISAVAKIDSQISQKFKISFVGLVGKSNLRKQFARKLEQSQDNFVGGGRSQKDKSGNRFIDETAKNLIYKSSFINLNLSDTKTWYGVQSTGFKGRLMEVFGQGGFCLSQYSKSLDFLLCEEKFPIFFRTEKEFDELVQRFSNDLEARAQIIDESHTFIYENYAIEGPKKELVKVIQKVLKVPMRSNYLMYSAILWLPVFGFISSLIIGCKSGMRLVLRRGT